MGGADPAPDIARHAALDQRLVAVARGIKLLNMVSWPASAQDAFLARWARGDTTLPVIAYPKHDFSAARRELDAIAAAADPDHPLGHYLIDAAHNW